MSLNPGIRLGPYEVTAQIGVGGMGEVYRATDTKLKRQVAIKVLPSSVSGDPDRLERFQREAEVLASLNHPNIAAIYGIEDTTDAKALVMELVEGPTLADRITRSAIPLDEALPIVKQVAEALEAAHEQGIIHRDLKPANIKVRPDGTVKVLDFGLAKAMDPAGSGQPAAGSPHGSMSPTISLHATQAGVILGTAAYMSPEQAKGRTVDKRSDVWAFGAVVYEMLTGQRAFAGSDISEVLASVLAREPDWTRLPVGVSPVLGTYIRRCLYKDPKQRIHDMADVRLALEGAFDTTVQQTAAPVVVRPRRRVALVGVAATIAGALVATTLTWVAMRPTPPRVSRTTVATSGAAALSIQGSDRDLAVTPDGAQVVYRGDRQILVRALDQLDPVRLSGVGAPRGLFVSPDGQWIGFFDGGSLKKVAITGGPPVTVTSGVDGNGARGATWDEDGAIIFATNATETGLRRVSAAGGESTVLTKPNRERGEGDHVWPEFLPGGRGVLFTITPATGSVDNSQVALLDVGTGTQTVLVRGGSHAHYVSSGHLVYGVAGTLRAIPFDLGRLEITGSAVPVVPQVLTTPVGAADFDVARNGTLVYVSGSATSALLKRTLVWVDRGGRATPVSEREAAYRAPRVSPEGKRVAVDAVSADGNRDVWVIDTERGTQTRLTSDAAVDSLPLWTRDGTRITFSSGRAGTTGFALYWMMADGSGTAEPLTQAKSNQGATSWSPDGHTLAFYDVGGQRDISTVTPGKAPVPFLQTAFGERGPTFSPDGRWLAYSSNETGREEIYITSYPKPGGRIAVSTTGGRSPQWSANGRELFYRNGRQMMAVTMAPGATLSIGTPRMLFEGDYVQEDPTQGAANYDVSADGQRFLLMKDAAPTAQATSPEPQINVVLNWTEELKRLVPTR